MSLWGGRPTPPCASRTNDAWLIRATAADHLVTTG